MATLNGLNGPLDWGNWISGLLAAFIAGGSSAVTSGVVVSMIDAKDFGMGTKNFFLMVGMMFLTHGTLSFFTFLKQSPMPPVKTVTRVETTVAQSNPPSLTTTTVERTETEPGK